MTESTQTRDEYLATLPAPQRARAADVLARADRILERRARPELCPAGMTPDERDQWLYEDANGLGGNPADRGRPIP